MPQLGQAYVLKVGTTTVGLLEGFSISDELDTTEINTFDNPDWAEHLGTMQSWSFDSDAVYSYEDSGQQALYAAKAGKVAVEVSITSANDTAGVYEWTGMGIVTSMSVEGEVNDAVKLSITIQGTGELTRAAITS